MQATRALPKNRNADLAVVEADLDLVLPAIHVAQALLVHRRLGSVSHRWGSA